MSFVCSGLPRIVSTCVCCGVTPQCHCLQLVTPLQTQVDTILAEWDVKMHRACGLQLWIRVKGTRRGVFDMREPALEATQGQMDGLFSQHPYNCHLEEVASVGD